MCKGLCKKTGEWANSRLGESVSDLSRSKIRLGEFKPVYSMITKFYLDEYHHYCMKDAYIISGSTVPFGMRVLHAELPHYMGRSQEALDRLYYVLAVVQKVFISMLFVKDNFYAP